MYLFIQHGKAKVFFNKRRIIMLYYTLLYQWNMLCVRIYIEIRSSLLEE
jgi:hypothetical protein